MRAWTSDLKHPHCTNNGCSTACQVMSGSDEHLSLEIWPVSISSCLCLPVRFPGGAIRGHSKL